ncbi:Crp/Fnr family transcriptional regulator [Aquimarina hainanensis]|uniref:Crp/Fnr family transcriptional regulator n=1 Tax=Aquimarina hainanensis TaxID=1578017 RepID=A0ABW5N8U3_9FLAO|nr:Crp/Fnr family transcriptional regulator [Aquimarina sp. TRL1]QKX05414.1 Crp/Fnr family transcriptional regulator [Aquimarina sp. TRL1]
MLGAFLKQYFDPIINLNLQVWENFATLGEVIEFPKETVLKESNSIERYLGFVLEGSGGNLLWDKNNFVCTDISFRNDAINDFISFTLQKASPIEVRLFEDSKIFRVSYQSFQRVFEKGNYGEEVSRLALESAYIEKQQQQIDLLTKTAKERYLEIIKKNGTDKHINLKYIASYLGITPQSLSRIRSELIL